MSDKLNFQDVQAYLSEHEIEISYDKNRGYLVEYRHGKKYKRPKFYRSLFNALLYNGSGLTEYEVMLRFEEWRLARWQKEAVAI
jgi:hypothetical protein